jgi:hypothetical protein
MERLDIPAPVVSLHQRDGSWELRADLDLSSAPGLTDEWAWQTGLSAVVETKDGGISYWALAHPPGKPDFHHPDSFALTLPPPELP